MSMIPGPLKPSKYINRFFELSRKSVFLKSAVFVGERVLGPFVQTGDGGGLLKGKGEPFC